MSQPSMANARKNLSFIYFLLLWISFVTSQTTPLSTDPSFYYNLCAPSKCGNQTLSYPFALPTLCHPPYVGITCTDDEDLLVHNPASTDGDYRILSTNFTDSKSVSLFLASNNLFTCGTHLSTPLISNYVVAFSLPIDYTPGTHYNCTSPIPRGTIQGLQNSPCIGCKGQDPSNICYYAPRYAVSGPRNCEIFSMLLPGGPFSFNASAVSDMRALLRKGYRLIFNKPLDCLGCELSGGRCGVNPTTNGSFICFCPSSVHSNNCTDEMPMDILNWVKEVGGKGPGLTKGVVAAILASASTLLLVVVVVLVLIFIRRRNKNVHFNKERISEISPTRYSYSQLKKFTNNFSTKLGQGGFGSVYKGTIQTTKGAEVTVAVKLLKQNTETEKQFMNEVASIGSVHHHNLVSILGYCVDRDTHALIYEFMENGSLDNYIYMNKKGNESRSDNRRLSNKQGYSIALETARGILYLHQGCRVKILHLDIKPSNVLVDSNFSAKVADFGLARMIDKDRSHVSLTGAQGTPGYAAPEMWLKSFGPVTEKSDVYSYGMLLLEIVGRRKIYDTELADSSGAYFPEWLYNKIARDEFSSLLKGIGGNDVLGDEEVDREEDEDVVRRMCLIGLWCIQNIPPNRPSMDRVLQMLEGHVEFGIPPNPFPQNTTISRDSSDSQDPLIPHKSR